jgi:hypothetical protein
MKSQRQAMYYTGWQDPKVFDATKIETTPRAEPVDDPAYLVAAVMLEQRPSIFDSVERWLQDSAAGWPCSGILAWVH